VRHVMLVEAPQMLQHVGLPNVEPPAWHRLAELLASWRNALWRMKADDVAAAQPAEVGESLAARAGRRLVPGRRRAKHIAAPLHPAIKVAGRHRIVVDPVQGAQSMVNSHLIAPDPAWVPDYAISRSGC